MALECLPVPYEIQVKNVVPHLNAWETVSYCLVSQAAYAIINSATHELQRNKTWEGVENLISLNPEVFPKTDIWKLVLQKLKMEILDEKPKLIDKLKVAKQLLTAPYNREHVQNTLQVNFPDATCMQSLFKYHVKTDSMGADTDTWLAIAIFDYRTGVGPIQPEDLEPALKFAVSKKNRCLVRAIMHSWNGRGIESDKIHGHVYSLIGSNDSGFKRQVFPFLLHRSLFKRIESIAYSRIGQLLLTSVQKNDTDCVRMILSHPFAAKIPATSWCDTALDSIVEAAENQGNQEIIGLVQSHPKYKSLEKEKTSN